MQIMRQQELKVIECLLLPLINTEIYPPLWNVKSVNCLRKLLALP